MESKRRGRVLLLAAFGIPAAMFCLIAGAMLWVASMPSSAARKSLSCDALANQRTAGLPVAPLPVENAQRTLQATGYRIDDLARGRAAFSADGRLLAVAQAGYLHIRNLEERAPQAEAPIDSGELRDLAWSPDSSRIVISRSAQQDNVTWLNWVEFRDASTLDLVGRLDLPDGTINSFGHAVLQSFSADGQYLLLYNGSTLFLVESQTGRVECEIAMRNLLGHGWQDWTTDLYSFAGVRRTEPPILVTQFYGRDIWHNSTTLRRLNGQVFEVIETGEDVFAGGSFSPGSDFLALDSIGAYSSLERLTIWSVDPPELVLDFGPESYLMAWSPDGTYALVYHSSHIEIWQPAEGRQVMVLPSVSANLWSAAWSTDGAGIQLLTQEGSVQSFVLK